MTDRPEAAPDPASKWILMGMRQVVSAPALILIVAHLGFAGLAREAGITWTQATFMVATIWALPANLILLGAVTAGLSLAATALAVAFSSLRMMPMVIALLPDLKGPETRRSTLLFLSHFVAVTAWVVALEKLPSVPRRHRTHFFGGFAITLTLINTTAVAFAFNLMGQLPALATGALAFFTPVYFLTSLYGSARESSARLALLTGLLAIPLAHWLTPGFDILTAGLVGGVVAFLIGRMKTAREADR